MDTPQPSAPDSEALPAEARAFGGPGGRWENPLYTLDAAMRAAGGDHVWLRHTAPRAVVNLRAGEGSLPDLGRVFGVMPPTTPNTWAASPDGQRLALWLGPDEWLLVAPDGTAPAIARGIRDTRPNDGWLAVVDLGHTYTPLMVTGRRARLVLSKGCRLDLHPRALPAGACVQTDLARARALLRFANDAGHDAIEIWVRNSFARYTALWLIDAMGDVAHEEADF